MHLRPSARLLASAGALALVTVLTSCGFDYASDRVYTPAAGVNDRDATVDVLGAAIVSGQEGSGTFVASFANNDQEQPATVESVAGSGDDASLKVDHFKPVEVPAGGLVNLATDGGIVITGDLAAGDFVELTIGFGDGDSVDLHVPVYPPCNEFEGLDQSSGSSTSSSDQCEPESPVGGEH